MSSGTLQKKLPSEATLFHLVPVNLEAKTALKQNANESFISTSDIDKLGLEIGFHIRGRCNHTIITSLGTPGNLIVATELYRSWLCVFEYIPDSKVVILQESFTPTEESLLQVKRGHGHLNYLGTTSRVLSYGERYTIVLGDDGPQFQVVWACHVLGRNVEDLPKITELKFHQSQHFCGLDIDSALVAAQARTSRIARAILKGTLPRIEQDLDGKHKRFIGRGGFGHVYKTVDLLFGIPIAMKECPVADEDTEQGQIDRALFKREVDVLKRIRHVRFSSASLIYIIH